MDISRHSCSSPQLVTNYHQLRTKVHFNGYLMLINDGWASATIIDHRWPTTTSSPVSFGFRSLFQAIVSLEDLGYTRGTHSLKITAFQVAPPFSSSCDPTTACHQPQGRYKASPVQDFADLPILSGFNIWHSKSFRTPNVGRRPCVQQSFCFFLLFLPLLPLVSV